ncbi:uncharacterized protein M421DRAFT_91127 [Didymella exigua CBS 183.55]|uniref:Thioesterase domain-containing protein n=1 Tax=Didymella exigua CBS 183.55 TaxID=1150837 RepID=A0A6A5RS91_9PLEO|nr:uncharacterized protein M421DRAFT_91127 [Didymella exigua CBS 183.55]KAF1930642.1 hypothetical protein M421DRAFT_91127 [Didymella exigua CBS 183.55]
MSRLPDPVSANGRIEHLQDFTSLDWCRELLSDPSMIHIRKRQSADLDVSNTFFNTTLFTDEALRAYLSMYKVGKIDQQNNEPSTLSKEEYVWSPIDPDIPETLLLVSLGRDVDGAVRRLHGGITAALLDQVMGYSVHYLNNIGSATADLNIKYKAAVTTPCVLLCRSKVVRQKGRWIETVGWIEDGHGKIFAEGKGSFVLKKALATAAKI